MTEGLDIRPATWEGFEAVMGPKGGSGGCWCMLWRQSAKAMKEGKGDANRAAMGRVFEDPTPPGLIARDGDSPVAWISVAPRRVFPRLEASKVMAAVDDMPVWVVACFLIQKPYRNQGLSTQLLLAAGDFAKSNGATHLEGYPSDPNQTRYAPPFAWTGLQSAFEKAGFIEIARRSPTRPVMRKAL